MWSDIIKRHKQSHFELLCFVAYFELLFNFLNWRFIIELFISIFRNVYHVIPLLLIKNTDGAIKGTIFSSLTASFNCKSCDAELSPSTTTRSEVILVICSIILINPYLYCSLEDAHDLVICILKFICICNIH